METARATLGCVTKGTLVCELVDPRTWRVIDRGHDDPRTARELEWVYSPPWPVEDEPAFARRVLDDLARRIGGRAVFPATEG